LFKESEFTDITNLLGEGFFADKVVSILEKPGCINSSGKEVLGRVQSFLEKVLEGQEQVKSSSLSSSTIESIDAYQRAVLIFQQVLMKKSEDITRPKFKELIGKMNKEVSEAMKTECIAPSDVNTTLNFFKYVRRATIVESSEYFSHRVALKWPQRTLYRLA
jgi:hypothetical protein